MGDVLGRYHPHGDQSVYDALVRLAQDFSTRYLLVDGHGNFGSVDGDPAAAYRYTEARLSKLSNEMLRDIDKDTVDWEPNFDESRKEPRVLPTAAAYVKRGSMNVTQARDLYLYSHVDRQVRQKESSSSGGGSRTHRSSSGRTHGGRGGKF